MTSSPWRMTSLILAALVAAYAPFLGGGFHTDDFVHLARLERASSLREILTVPDAFGFFRPLTQASLATDAALFGHSAVGYRVVNLGLHASVLGVAFVVARMVLPSEAAAAAAVLAFALTPKAHPIAVLWISARGELLMALLSLACVASWIKWTRAGGRRWLATSACCYLAVLLLWWRADAGALTPFSKDAHYRVLSSVTARSRVPNEREAPGLRSSNAGSRIGVSLLSNASTTSSLTSRIFQPEPFDFGVHTQMAV